MSKEAKKMAEDFFNEIERVNNDYEQGYFEFYDNIADKMHELLIKALDFLSDFINHAE